MFRSIVFLTLASGGALGAWSSFSEETRPAWDSVELVSEVVDEPRVPDSVSEPSPTAIDEPLHFVSAETIAAISCGPWDVSAAGIEAILDEMIRRGWTPPTRAVALANLHPQFGLLVPVDDTGADKIRAPTRSDLRIEAVEPDELALPSGPSQADGKQPRRYTN